MLASVIQNKMKEDFKDHYFLIIRDKRMITNPENREQWVGIDSIQHWQGQE